MKKSVFLFACFGALLSLTVGIQSAAAQGYWWAAPELKYVEIMEDGTHGTSPHYWTFGGPDENDSTNDQTYLYSQDSGTNAYFCQYVVAELRAAENADEVAHRWAIDHIGLPKGCSQFGRFVMIGNGGQSQEIQPFYAYPDDYTIGPDSENILEADVSADCDPLHFNHDGTLLYTNHYVSDTGSRSSLQRYQVTGSLENNGVAFTRDVNWKDNGVFLSSVARLRNFTVRYINGKDLIFYGEGATTSGPSSVYVLDPESGEETLLVENVFSAGEVEDADIVNVKLSGVTSGNLFLHVMGNIGGLKIYALSPDAMQVENGGEPVAVLTTDDLNAITGSEAFSSHCRAYEVTDDHEYAFFSSHNAYDSIFVIRTQPGTAVKSWENQ
ncbi:MAG: hypothetical protein JXR73_00745 [Candidatus Omnitrophica bacterium]|nr:hypothetical protein [Candidatus Omnitrophota bacterium]